MTSVDIQNVPFSLVPFSLPVVFERGAFCKRYEADDQITEAFNSAFDESDDDLWTITGNVHQNPELLSAWPTRCPLPGNTAAIMMAATRSRLPYAPEGWTGPDRD